MMNNNMHDKLYKFDARARAKRGEIVDAETFGLTFLLLRLADIV